MSKRGFWPLADQGVASLGNILTVFLVARGVSKEEFGSFTLILEAMFFLVSMHAAFITYPLTVKGAIADDSKLRHLSTGSLLLTLFLAVPMCIAAIAVGTVSHLLALTLVAVVGLVTWQMQETVRRALMCHFRHGQAIWGDSINYLLQAVLLVILYRMGKLTLLTALGAMAFTTILALIVQALQVGLSTVSAAELRGMAKDFWISGRWVAMTNLGGLCLMFCGNWALGLSHGRTQVADFAAIASLLKIFNPVVLTIGGLIVPSAAKAFASGGLPAARRISFKLTMMGSLLLAPFLVILTVVPHWCLQLAFHGRYSSPEHMLALRILVLGNIMVFLNAALSSYFNGVHKPRYAFYGQLAGNISMFAVLLPMVLTYGWMGYVVGGIAQVVIQFAVLAWCLRMGKPQAVVAG
jgi:O-antigen/teichoic acid export membrane protein